MFAAHIFKNKIKVFFKMLLSFTFSYFMVQLLKKTCLRLSPYERTPHYVGFLLQILRFPSIGLSSRPLTLPVNRLHRRVLQVSSARCSIGEISCILESHGLMAHFSPWLTVLVFILKSTLYHN